MTSKLSLIGVAIAAVSTIAIPATANARETKAQTTAVCSYEVKPASCYLIPGQAASTSLSLAQSILPRGHMTAIQFNDWTQGVCSYQVKPASCYLTPSQARLASAWLAKSMGVGVTTHRGT